MVYYYMVLDCDGNHSGEPHGDYCWYLEMTDEEHQEVDG